MARETILITGAAGFTGRHFVALASSKGFRCIAMCQNSEDSVAEADE